MNLDELPEMLLELVDLTNERLEVRTERQRRKINPYKYDALKNIEKYDYLRELYDKILNNCAKLLKELNIKNNLDIANFLTYLIWNGYFSKDRIIRYEIKNRLSLKGFEALDIMDGRGVCLDFSILHKDLLNKLDIKAAVIYNHPSFLIRNYHPDFERKFNISKFENLVNYLNKKNIDHACTLVKDDKGLYIYDSTNILLANIENENLATIENGSGNFSLKINSTKRECLNSEELKLLELLENTYEFNPVYSRRDFILSFEDMTKLANDNNNLLNSFYEETKDTIDSIARDIKILKLEK